MHPHILVFISTLALSCSSVLSAQSWPLKGWAAPKNFKAFPSRDKCRLEVVFERDDREYDYYVFGQFEKAASPVWLPALERADYTKWPISVVNGTASEDRGAYPVGEGSFTTFTPLVVNLCPKDIKGNKFLGEVFVKATAAGNGTPGKLAWQSDLFKVQGKPIPIGGVKITGVTVRQQDDHKSIHGEEPPADVKVQWELHNYDPKNVEGFFVHVGPLTSDDKHLQAKWVKGANVKNATVTIENYGKPDVQRKVYTTVTIKTKQGSFTDPATVPQQPVVIYK